MKDIEKIREIFKTPQKPFITTHIRPDGDALGCVLALHKLFKANGHDPVTVIPSEYPYYYHWFPGVDEILDFHKHKKQALNALKEATIIFVVDFNSLHRNGELGLTLAESKLPKVIIDHHSEPEQIYDYWFWDVKACATGEILFEFIENFDSKMLADQDICTNLYSAINTDCGSFKFPSTTTRTHKIVSALLASGIKPGDINTLLYDNFTERRLRFWGKCLTEKLTILPEYHTAIITVTKKDLMEYQLKTSDLEGLAHYPLIIEDILLAAFLVERDRYVKVSFRSKYDFPTNQLARKYFNGGGHLNASGGEIALSLEETTQLFIEKIKEFEVFLTKKN